MNRWVIFACSGVGLLAILATTLAIWADGTDRTSSTYAIVPDYPHSTISYTTIQNMRIKTYITTDSLDRVRAFFDSYYKQLGWGICNLPKDVDPMKLELCYDSDSDNWITVHIDNDYVYRTDGKTEFYVGVDMH